MRHYLDLHGTRHQDVDLKVENFIYLNQDSWPLTIMFGNSVIMSGLVKATLDRIGCNYLTLRNDSIIVSGF